MAPRSLHDRLDLIHDLDHQSDHSSTFSVLATAKQPLHQEVATFQRVSFAVAENVVSIIHHSEFTSEERSSTWYSKNELREMKADIKSTVDLLNSAHAPTGICQRGLESRLPQKTRQRANNRQAAYTVVLREQDRQRSAGERDDLRIAALYAKTVGEACQSAAFKQGRIDARAVRL